MHTVHTMLSSVSERQTPPVLDVDESALLSIDVDAFVAASRSVMAAPPPPLHCSPHAPPPRVRAYSYLHYAWILVQGCFQD